MLCNDFRCQRLDDDNMCDQIGGECIGDMCEDWGECRSCQQLTEEECDGLRK